MYYVANHSKVHINKGLKKMCVDAHFLPDHTVLGVGGLKGAHFFSTCPKVCPESFALLLSVLGCPEML